QELPSALSSPSVPVGPLAPPPKTCTAQTQALASAMNPCGGTRSLETWLSRASLKDQYPKCRAAVAGSRDCPEASAAITECIGRTHRHRRRERWQHECYSSGAGTDLAVQ